VVGFSLIHREQGKTFTRVRVQVGQDDQGNNLVIIPPKEDEVVLHHIWLQNPIEGREINRIFDVDIVSGILGFAGLKYVALAGYALESAGGDGTQESEHIKKQKHKKTIR
jgi:hypothetical protein